MRADLKRLARDTTSSHIAAVSEQTRPHGMLRARWWLWPVGVVALLTIAYLLRPTLPPPEVTRTTQLTKDNGPKTYPDSYFALVSDGSRIYFHEPNWPDWGRLFQVSTEGGESEPARLPNGSGYLLGISPTRPELLMLGDAHRLMTMAVPGGQPRRIGNLTADDAAWSPDGSKLYYNSKDSIYSAAPDGSDAHKLLTVKGEPYWMRFSPDGRVLRFTVTPDHDGHTRSLWEAHADGSHLHQLLPGFTNPASDCCGSWTPDGKYYIFQATRDWTSALWAIRESGDWRHKVSHAPVRLTQGVMGAYFPLPGKDGKIYFVGVMPRGELTRYDLKTRSLSPFLGGISASGLSFSKDGKHLVFMSYPDDVLWFGNSDGSGLRQLTFPPMQAGYARMSPDGSQIAYMASMPGKPIQIYVIPVDGGDAEAITSGSQESEEPTWSPSGDALLYWSSGNDAANGSTALHIVTLKTRVVTAIPGSSGLFSPRWSPDGRYLVALTWGDYPRLKLYDMNLHTWQDLTGDIGVGNPEWTPDSKCIIFGFIKGTANWEDRVCLANRKIQPITDMSAIGLQVNDPWSWGWRDLAPDGSLLALRDISTQEIYALDVKWP
jgi:Tol biopolymer transport system component